MVHLETNRGEKEKSSERCWCTDMLRKGMIGTEAQQGEATAQTNHFERSRRIDSETTNTENAPIRNKIGHLGTQTHTTVNLPRSKLEQVGLMTVKGRSEWGNRELCLR